MCCNQMHVFKSALGECDVQAVLKLFSYVPSAHFTQSQKHLYQASSFLLTTTTMLNFGEKPYLVTAVSND